MAFLNPFPYAPNLLVSNDDSEFYRATVDCLAELENLPGVADSPSGKTFLREIGSTEHTIKIYRTDGGNKCKSVEVGRFVRLKDAFMQTEGYSISEELTYSLDEAAANGLSTKHIASQLVSGLSAATIHTDKNVARHEAWPVHKSSVDLMLARLQDLKLGHTTHFESDIARGLIRLLRRHLRPGNGARAGVAFNAFKSVACELDAKGTQRPPAIGLAHELVHAWRNVKGLRLFDDAQGQATAVDDDEIMTTGFPPYANEKYTENKFRLAWHIGGGQKLEMRTDYRTYAAEAAAEKING